MTREVQVAYLLRERTDFSVTEKIMVDRRQRSDLYTGAAEKGFIGQIELRAVDVANLDRDAQLGAG